MHPEHARKRLWLQETLPLLHQSTYWRPLLQHKQNVHLDDFPITVYEDYQEELLAAQQSLIQPFNGERLIFWSETSGTSGVRKFFQLRLLFRNNFSAQWLLISIH